MGPPRWLGGKESTCNAADPEAWVRSLGWEEPLEEEMATHSRILAWRIPWREEPGVLQSMGLQRVGHDLRLNNIEVMTVSDMCVCEWTSVIFEEMYFNYLEQTGQILLAIFFFFKGGRNNLFLSMTLNQIISQILF